MDPVEAALAGRTLAWMATEGRFVTIEERGDDFFVTWNGHPDWFAVVGHGPDLAAAVLDALRRARVSPPGSASDAAGPGS